MTIEVLNVSKNYEGKPYLKSVSLDISSGSVISVVGKKKSGKTALLRIIMGLEEADRGQVTLLGDYKYDRLNVGVVFQDDRLCPGFTAAQNEEADGGQVNLLGDYKYDRLNVGAVFQDDRLCPGFTAAQNVAMVNKRFSVRAAEEELEKLLPAGTADLPVEDLTPAQRRMVCIIRACIIPSDVRLMDEPFAGMTKEEKEKSIAYLRSVMANTPLVITCLPGEELPFGRTFHLT